MITSDTTPQPSNEGGPRHGRAGWLTAGLIAIIALGIGPSFYGCRHSKAKMAPPAATQAAPKPAQHLSLIAQGGKLFAAGCIACHGKQGKGGVVDANTILGTVPRLNDMADKLMLNGPSDAKWVIAQLTKGKDPSTVKGKPPFDGYARFAAAYKNVRKVIDHGSTPGMKDPKGQKPPLVMPVWGKVLKPHQIDALVAYLISVENWDD